MPFCKLCDKRTITNHRHAGATEIRDPYNNSTDGQETGYGQYGDVLNPTEDRFRPMQNIGGLLQLNQHTVGHYANDMDFTPITFNRIGTRWGDAQLKNGLANYTASGRIYGYRGEGWYDVTVPYLPGQTRLISGRRFDFPVQGNSPSQWQQAFDSTAGSQADYPGGPGQIVSGYLDNPGSGG